MTIIVANIKKSREFRSFYKANKIIGTYFMLYYDTNASFFTYGITVTKKTGSAVDRNRCKRIVRALIREYVKIPYIQLPICKVNIVIKQNIACTPFLNIRDSLFFLINKLHRRHI